MQAPSKRPVQPAGAYDQYGKDEGGRGGLPVVQRVRGTIVLLLGVMTVIGTLVSDILLVWIDPRIRLEDS